MKKRKVTTLTDAGSRRARRKEERLAKKKRRKLQQNTPVDVAVKTSVRAHQLSRKSSNEKGGQNTHLEVHSDNYSRMDSTVAAALRAEDLEIELLQEKLGLKGRKGGKKKLNKEYAKLEGYGEDFGDFLDDLDGMVGRITEESAGSDSAGGDRHSEEESDGTDHASDLGNDSEEEKYEQRPIRQKKSNEDYRSEPIEPDAGMDEEMAAAILREDSEIAELEKKLGLTRGGEKERQRLSKEYAKLEGYGDDFGHFLDDLENLTQRLSGKSPPAENKRSDTENNYSSNSDGDCVEPMKDGAMSEEEDFDDDFHERLASGKLCDIDNDLDNKLKVEDFSSVASLKDASSGGPTKNNSESDPKDGDVEAKEELDHEPQLTYCPVDWEDLYGNRIDQDVSSSNKPTRYIPPHLRKHHSKEKNELISNDDEAAGSVEDKEDSAGREDNFREIERSLNSVLNRLSDNMLESVSKAVAGIYQQYPTNDVNKCYLKNIKNACVRSNIIMSGLVPIYIACASGVHFQAGDDVQLGGNLLENFVLDLCRELELARERNKSSDGGGTGENILHEPNDSLSSNKKASNLALILCYLYNYNVAHCSLMYDIIRELIEHFHEVDIEVLLLILSHCGYQLRSDDPAALKDIVLLVQNRAISALEEGGNSSSPYVSSSRVQYMIGAMTDLKNSKRRNKDEVIGLKTAGYRKTLGRVKSSAAGRTFDACMRIKLQDIREIETKGRWWKVGAKWRGNQFQDNGTPPENDSNASGTSSRGKQDSSTKEEDALFALASKYRMNSDLRRSIFFVLTGSSDCEDAFEKLVRGGMLKGKAERDTIRVLTECCSQEDNYNPYYAHLARRICDYQPNCKFTLRLTYYDAYKQFNSMTDRKAANLAKLLAHLLADGQCLNLSMLKAIDIDGEDMPENAVIFLMVLFTALFDSFEDPLQIKHIFEIGMPPPKKRKGRKDLESGSESLAVDDSDALKRSLSIFLLQYLKSSPKNAKKSSFRANFKAAVKACETDGLESMIPV